MIIVQSVDKLEQSVVTTFCDIVNENSCNAIQEILLYCNNIKSGNIDFLCSEGFIEIIDLKVDTQQLGHGKLLIETLFQVTPVLSEKLINLGHNGIRYITGKIEPDDRISYDDLVLVYKKLGFEIRDRHIYKEI